MLCPFCLRDYGKPLGAIFISAPRELEKGETTAGEKACITCLSLLAQLLDTWREGGIVSFQDRARSAGLLRELEEYVESGSRPLG